MGTSDIPAFQYTPGDNHRYVWDGRESIIVQRIYQEGAAITFVPTGDVIPAPTTRTATAMCAAVNAWRTALHMAAVTS